MIYFHFQLSLEKALRQAVAPPDKVLAEQPRIVPTLMNTQNLSISLRNILLARLNISDIN